MKNSLDMTHGPLAGKIMGFSLPLMFSYILQVLFNMADIAAAGRFAGAEALGSVGSCAILCTLFTGFLFGISGGINVTAARHLGAGEDKAVRQTVHTGLFISLIIGLGLLAGGAALARQVLTLMRTKDELIGGAVVYLRIYMLGMPALAVYNWGNAVLGAAGDTRRPLYCMAGSGVLNVGLNLLFVIRFHWGVAGVAVASVLSETLSAALIVVMLRREQSLIGLRREHMTFDTAKARHMLALGVPSGLQNAIFAFANLFIQASVNSFDAIMVEGNSAAANADGLIYDVMAAFYAACASFMSQNLGARQPRRALRCYGISLLYSFGAGAILGLSLKLFGRPFLGLFTTDPAVIEAGLNRISVMSLSYAISAFMDCPIAASRSLGKSVVPMVFVFLGSCVFRVIWVYTVFAHFRTIQSLYLLYVFSWTLTAIAENIYFFRIYRASAGTLAA